MDLKWAYLFKFFYNGGDEVENMRMYKPGGYHPVALGDVLPKNSTTAESRKPRYRVLQKLGHGAFATVWLARDLQEEFGYVALKVNISRITGKNKEICILQWLAGSENRGHPGYKNILQLFDSFTIQGPNGIHDCLVTEVVIGMQDLRYNALDYEPYVKGISNQCLMGLSYLHEKGLAHGDLHLHNLAIAAPELQSRSEAEIMQYFSDTDIIPVVAQNPSEQNDSLPTYVTPYISLVEYLTGGTCNFTTKEPLCAKIMDYGNSFREGIDERPPPNTPISIRAPEVTYCELSDGKICSGWNKAVDVWAAACTIYELARGGVMFYGLSKGDEIIYHTFEAAGPPPHDWQKYWDLDNYCKKKGVPKTFDSELFWNRRLERWTRGDSSLKYDKDQLVDLLRKMLIINPAERPQVNDLLGHPWFAPPNHP